MIEKTEETKHKWHVSVDEYETGVISVEDGEIWMTITDKTPPIEQAKEFHQALAEAIAIAEAQE